jgi:hypothetical protein
VIGLNKNADVILQSAFAFGVMSFQFVPPSIVQNSFLSVAAHPISSASSFIDLIWPADDAFDEEHKQGVRISARRRLSVKFALILDRRPASSVRLSQLSAFSGSLAREAEV